MTIIPGTSAQLSRAELGAIAMHTARQPGQWLSLVRYDADRRWYLRLLHRGDYEIWLLSWLPGQQTGFHDHGPAAGAFTVTSGCLHERAAAGGRPEPAGRALLPGAVRTFGPGYTHDVRNESVRPAVSIHAYSPPLTSMRRFAITAGGLLRLTGEERSW